MSTKGISFIEASVEKFVLVVVLLIFLGVLVLQLAVEPNRVQVGTSGKKVAPTDAFKAAEEEARLADGRMRAEGLDLPAPPEVALLDEFESMRTGSVSPRTRVAIGTGVPTEVIENPGATTPTGTATFADVLPPAPSSVLAYDDYVTIDPRVVVQYPGLKDVLPAAQPFDTPLVSVQASFSGTELRQAYLNDPDGESGPIQPMRSGWWRDSVEIVAVQMERERLADHGEWTDAQMVPPMPGQRMVLQAIEGEERPSAEAMRQLITSARSESEQVLRPGFYGVIAPSGWEWKPPAELVGADAIARQAEIGRKQRKLEDLRSTAETIEEQMNEPSGGGRSDPPPGRGGRDGGRDGGRNPSPPTDQNDRRKEQLQRRLDSVLAQIDTLEQELRDLGWVPEDEREQPGRDLSRPNENQPLLDIDQVDLWAHDISAHPGTTYRYRLRVAVNNPAFGKRGISMTDQRELRDRPVTFGEWSDWSEPVEVLPNQAYFVVNGSPGTGIGGAIASNPRASVEVFRFYYGQWHEASVLLEPGDAIVDSLTLDPELVPVADMALLEEGAGAPLGQPGEDRGRPGGYDPRDDRDRRRPPPDGGVPGGAPEGEELPAGWSPGPRELPIELAVMMMDVASGIQGGQGSGRDVEVLLRLPSGRIVRIDPVKVKSDPAYQRLKGAAADTRRSSG